MNLFFGPPPEKLLETIQEKNLGINVCQKNFLAPPPKPDQWDI